MFLGLEGLAVMLDFNAVQVTTVTDFYRVTTLLYVFVSKTNQKQKIFTE